MPPVPGSDPAPKTSALAIWSLVLGILSLTCFSIFTAIPGVVCGHVSLSRIKKSAGTLGGRSLAISGLVTGYIGLALGIVLIPLMFAIVIPNFTKARAQADRNARATAEKKACIAGLETIKIAKDMWDLDYKKKTTDIPTEQDLLRYLPGGLPHCPGGGVYSINAVGEDPTCSIKDHRIPDHHLPK